MTNGNTAGSTSTSAPALSFADFATQLQAAQNAIDRLPAIERERDDALRQRDDAQAHGEKLELRIQNYKSLVDDLTLKLRDAEASAATFRQQSEDHASQRDRLVSAFETAVSMVQDEVRQIVPQPQPEPEVATAPTPVFPFHSDPVPSTQTPPAVDPAPYTPGTGPAYGDDDTPMIPTPEPAAPQSYAGLAYHNLPSWISNADWLANGGTQYGYDWRPSADELTPNPNRLGGVAPEAVYDDGKPESQSYTDYSGERKTYG